MTNNPNDTTHKTSTGSTQGGSTGSNQKTFKCSDAGHPNCNWQVSGRDENEIMPKIEQHGREAHNMQNFDNDTRQKVRSAIREPRAA